MTLVEAVTFLVFLGIGLAVAWQGYAGIQGWFGAVIGFIGGSVGAYLLLQLTVLIAGLFRKKFWRRFFDRNKDS